MSWHRSEVKPQTLSFLDCGWCFKASHIYRTSEFMIWFFTKYQPVKRPRCVLHTKCPKYQSCCAAQAHRSWHASLDSDGPCTPTHMPGWSPGPTGPHRPLNVSLRASPCCCLPVKWSEALYKAYMEEEKCLHLSDKASSGLQQGVPCIAETHRRSAGRKCNLF